MAFRETKNWRRSPDRTQPRVLQRLDAVQEEGNKSKRLGEHKGSGHRSQGWCFNHRREHRWHGSQERGRWQGHFVMA